MSSDNLDNKPFLQGERVYLKKLRFFDELIEGRVTKVGRKYLKVEVNGSEIEFCLGDLYERSKVTPIYQILCKVDDYGNYLVEQQDIIFEKLIEPIKWSYSTSISYRKNLVTTKHSQLKLVYPFLTRQQKEIAKEWFKRETHSGLWD